MVEGELTVKVTDVEVPFAGTLPDPDHPVQRYCVPVPPLTGEVTDAAIDEPASNQPLAGLGES